MFHVAGVATFEYFWPIFIQVNASFLWQMLRKTPFHHRLFWESTWPSLGERIRTELVSLRPENAGEKPDVASND